jgi:hypothetical protein
VLFLAACEFVVFSLLFEANLLMVEGPRRCVVTTAATGGTGRHTEE